MLAGEPYWAGDPELLAERRRCRDLLRAYEAEPDEDRLRPMLGELLGSVGRETYVERPFRCDYGYNIALGEHTFLNYGVTILDVVAVQVGDWVKIGPNVQLLTADHPLEPARRRAGEEYGRPVTIGSDVWIGGGAIVCPGVTVGAGTTIGAGSVVTRDVPGGVLAAGVPCRVLRDLS